MSGPWEKYARAEAGTGPWVKYQDASAGGVQDWEPTQFSTGDKIARGVGLGAQGVNDALANAAGAPVDAVAWLLRQAGVEVKNPVGGSESIKRGIDYLASLPGAIGITNPGAPVRLEPLNQTERIVKGTGEGVGNALSVMLPAGVLANSGRLGPVGTGIANALRTDPVTQIAAGAVQGGVTEATDSPWLGLAAGAAVPVGAAVVRRVVTPFTNRLTPQEARLAAAADAEGIPLTPAQRTGNPSLQTWERTAESAPGSSGPMKERFGEQRRAFNQAVLRRAGITADEASPDVIEAAFHRAGQEFNNLAQRTTLNVDRRFAQDVANVVNDYGRRLDTNIAPVFRSYVDDIEPLIQAVGQNANPQIAGDTYARIHTGINRTIRNSSNAPELQQALRGLLDALDGVVERSTSGALRNEWQNARREYQALMTVDKAMRGGTQTDRIRADIPLNALRQAVVQADPRGFSRGRGQLNELSRVGDFIASRVPDSGTAARQASANWLHAPFILGNRIAAGLYNTAPVDAYLTNQLAGPTPWGSLYGGIMARQAIEESRRGDNALVRPRGAP